MLNLTHVLKARFATAMLAVVALVMLAALSAGQSVSFAAAPFGGPSTEQALPGSGSLNIVGGGREIATRQRIDVFRLSGHPQSASDDDQPMDVSWQRAHVASVGISTPSVPAYSVLTCAHVSPFDARGPPAA